MKLTTKQLRSLINEVLTEATLSGDAMTHDELVSSGMPTETTYEVYVSDTLRGASDRRRYKTLKHAEDRYNHLMRTLRRNGHNYVVLSRQEEDGTWTQVYPARLAG